MSSICIGSVALCHDALEYISSIEISCQAGSSNICALLNLTENFSKKEWPRPESRAKMIRLLTITCTDGQKLPMLSSHVANISQ